MTTCNGRPAGYTVRIFMPDGDPNGIRLVEKSHWTGQGIVFTRETFPKLSDRKDSVRAGVYVLWEQTDGIKLPRVYVGESEELLDRIGRHLKDSSKDFWTHGIIFTSKDDSLNKAHARHIEAKLIDRAREVKQCEPDNLNKSRPAPLSELDRADAESFLYDVLLCLPVAGVRFFEQLTVPSDDSEDLIVTSKGITARGQFGSDGFVVRKGSQAVKDETRSAQDFVVELRKQLVELGVLKDLDDRFEFTKDHLFKTPSAASGAVLGRSSNGLADWKDADGRTLKEIRSAGDG